MWFSMKIYGFWKIFFAQNKAKIIINLKGEWKKMFHYRIQELKYPTKLNLTIYWLIDKKTKTFLEGAIFGKYTEWSTHKLS